MFCPFLCGFGWGLMSCFLPTSPAQAGGSKEERGASASVQPPWPVDYQQFACGLTMGSLCLEREGSNLNLNCHIFRGATWHQDMPKGPGSNYLLLAVIAQ